MNTKGAWLRPDGYIGLQASDDPTATINRQALQHRVVFYDHAGPGWHLCVGCGVRFRWFSTLRVTHLDGDKANNDPANLAASCHRCATLDSAALRDLFSYFDLKKSKPLSM